MYNDDESDFEQWAHNEVININNSLEELESIVINAYRAGYQQGYDEGFEIGKTEGYDEGYKDSTALEYG